MRDFPKKYKQIKSDFYQQNNKKEHPFFFLPEQYTDNLDIEQIFRLFVLDTLHFIHYWEHLLEVDFLTNPILKQKEESEKIRKSLKKQLKSFWLPYLKGNFDRDKDISFSFFLQDFFAENYRKWIFFEDRFLVYRSPKNQTPIDFDLVEQIPSKKNRYTIKYFVSTKNHSLDVITENPETIFWDVAIAIHPQHKKAKQLKWQEAIIPIINKTIPIIIDERADFTRYWWVYRVTPGHDKLWLAIAKDHDLPIDTYAIDKDGFFTDNGWLFAKKPAEEFFSNIIQSLSDIWNLTKTEKIDWTTPICKQNKEHLIFRSWKWFFAKIPDDFVLDFFKKEQIISLSIDSDYINNSYWIASSHQKKWIPIPLRTNWNDTFLLDSQWLQEIYEKSDIKNGFAFWLFILHCVSTKLISTTFSAEDLVSTIFDHKKEAFEKLFLAIQKKYPKTKKEFDWILKIIDSLEQEKSIDKNVWQLIEILDDSFCLEKWEHGKYKFAFEKLDPNTKNIKHYNQVVNYDFLITAIFLKKIENNNIIDWWVFCTNENTLKTIIKIILFLEYYTWKQIIDKISTIPSLKNKKEAITFPIADIEITKKHHPDCVKIGFLSLSDWKNNYWNSTFENRDFSISKFWNSCRYIKTTFFPWPLSKETSFKKIQKTLEDNVSEFSAFDSWIISKTNSLIEEQQQISSPEQIWIFIKNIFDFIHNDFSSKYLELIKTAPSSYSDKISLCIAHAIILLLRPYLPIITDELLKIFWLEDDADILWFLKHFSNIQKNYSISLFMEIIDKFSAMKNWLCLKKHDSVSIFIRSNPDFIKFAKDNEYLFNKTLNAQEVLYLVHHEKIPCGYQKEDIIDISIWLKTNGKKTISGLAFLQKQLKEKEEYLQYLKNLVQQMSSSNTENIIVQQKKEEISKIKESIEELNFEISKCKMKE